VAFGDVLAVLEEQPERSGLASEDELPPEGLVLEIGERTLLIADPVMLHVYTQLRRLALSPLSVLLVGETGTGKDLAASALHAWSKRHEGPFVSINCAAIPEALVESELFGHTRGAFTGANRQKVGLLESASGGTLFLDEIGDLPTSIQPKLLRVLETQRLMPIGSVRERSIDVRVVTATHRDLAADVRAGRFRRDLYYRLSAALVQLPPLRARHREIPLLARRFLREACAGLGRPALKISGDALERLVGHDWPGNVRELKNVMEYAAALVDGPLSAKDVSAAFAKETSVDVAPAVPPSTPPHDLRAAKQELERRSIDAALAASGGNKTRAAKMLQMPLRTLMWKLKRFGKREGN
jgi:two-component system, NtrC family, response regulator AtoC